MLLTGDWRAAEDLVQASLAKLYCAWPRIRAAGPDAYMRQVMVNTQRSWWRARWRRERPAPDLWAVTPEGFRTEDLAERHMLRLLVRQALAALPAGAGRARAAVLRGPAGRRGRGGARLLSGDGPGARAPRDARAARVRLLLVSL